MTMTSDQIVDGVPDQVLVFALGGERYCVDIELVDEIVERGTLRALPDTPSHVVGMMDLRGDTATILDPKQVLETDADTEGSFVVVLETDADEPIGWLVDEALEVTRIPEDEIEAVTDNAYVNGVVPGEDAFTVWVDPDGVADGEIG